MLDPAVFCGVTAKVILSRSPTEICTIGLARFARDRRGWTRWPSRSLTPVLASAFVAHWCAGAKVETAGAVFQVRADKPAPRVGAREHSIRDGQVLDPASGRLQQIRHSS